MKPSMTRGELRVIADTDHVQCGDAAAMANMLLELLDGWIKCSDRMPEKGGLYLCYVQDDYEFDISHFCFEYLAAHKKFDSAGIKITHWMPLLAAPEQEVKVENIQDIR